MSPESGTPAAPATWPSAGSGAEPARGAAQAAGRRRILVATRSLHKLNELRDLLHLPETDLLSLDDVGVAEEAVEDAATFRANAILKARFYAGLSGLPTLADDSGLEVDALGGGPGVRTRRYASETATDEENNAKLLRELAGLPAERRGARYSCVLAYVDPTGANAGTDPTGRHAGAGHLASPGRAFRGSARAVTRSGTFEGRIAVAPRGSNGFGYDPIFEPSTEPPGGRTVGQLTQGEKNRVSHRARAATAMARLLRSQRL